MGPAIEPAAGLFEADDGTGRALWSVNVEGSGYEAARLLRPRPLPAGRVARNVVSAPGGWLFVAETSAGRPGLWFSDGTAPGTRELPLRGAPALANVEIAGNLDSRTSILRVTSVGGPCAGPQAWMSDGTDEGTHPLLPPDSAAPCATVASLVTTYGRAFGVFDDGVHGRQLWTTDGTPRGTLRLTSFRKPDPFSGSELRGVDSDVGFLFFADDGRHGSEPWITDGTPGGTRLLADLCPGPCSSRGEAQLRSFIENPSGSGAVLMFTAWTPATGTELWETDGTTAGTRMLGDLCPGPCSSNPDDIFSPVSSSIGVVFSAETAPGERAEWTTDGTLPGTRRLTPPNVRVTLHASVGWAFAASDDTFGEELWGSYGTPETTRLWFDIGRERDSGSYPQPIAAAGPETNPLLLLSAFDAEHGKRLWTSDGTAAGTHALSGGGPVGWNVTSAASVGGRAFYTGWAHGGPGALWSSSGASAPVRLVTGATDVQPGLVAAGARAFFTVRDHGQYPLWSSAGTPATTARVASGETGQSVVLPRSPGMAFRGRLVIQRVPDGNYWITDGSSTEPLAQAFPFLTSMNTGHGAAPLLLDALGNTFFVAARDNNFGATLNVSDGTQAAPTVLTNQISSPRVLMSAGSRVYLVASDGHGNDDCDLWVTDGTAGGTRRLPASVALSALAPTAVGDGLLFASREQAWFTDGTPEGTVAVRDDNGNPVPSYDGMSVAVLGGRAILSYGGLRSPCLVWGPGEPARPVRRSPLCGGPLITVGARVYVSGFTSTRGAELWAIEDP